jgi:hypothetical protein
MFPGLRCPYQDRLTVTRPSCWAAVTDKRWSGLRQVGMRFLWNRALV